MSYNVGFDLGTHQTKICIQDSTNPAEKTYEFLEFEKPNGEKTVLFPSLVQINKDHTLSYGFVNEDECLILGGTTEPCPELELMPDLPPLVLPKFVEPKNYPPKPKFDPWKDNLKRLKGEKTDVDAWQEQCDDIRRKAQEDWVNLCNKLQREYNSKRSYIKNKNVELKRKYTIELEKWEKDSIPVKLSFRYFKLSALTKCGTWEYKDFSSSEITVWYISYILMFLREKYGDDYSVQFGVPCGASNTHRDKIIIENAYEVYIAAADLINNYSCLEDYLNATYEELKQQTKYRRIDEVVKNQYYFDDIPEAFAGLVSITQQRKLGMGFHLLVDIGGGTTDIALFCISKQNHPDVLYVTSMPNGINSILEETQSIKNTPLHVLQSEFLINPNNNLFNRPVKSYKGKLVKISKEVIDCIEKSFLKSYYHHGRNLSELQAALENQPVIFGGGGGTISPLRKPLLCFRDMRKIDKDMLSIKNLKNTNIPYNSYTILATSYGLASFEKPYDIGIQCTDISVAFETFLPRVIRHNCANDKYDHGLSDI